MPKRVPARKLRIVFVVSATIAAAGTFVAAGFFRSADAGNAPAAIDAGKTLSALTRKVGVREGDLILRHGNGLWSNFIRDSNLSDKRFSHVGVVVRGVEGEFFVVHADCDAAGLGEVRREPLANFLREARRVGVLRPRAGVPAARVRAAESFVGRPFDRNFDLADDSELYCTELVLRAVRDADPGFSARTFGLAGREIVPADAFSDPAFAEELFDSGAEEDEESPER